MSLTENSDQVFLPGGCNRTPNLKFGPYTKSYEAIIQWWAIIGTPAKHHLNDVSLTGRCWPAFSGICFLSPSLKKLSVLQSWTGPPLTKLSGSSHDKNQYIDNPMQNRQALTRGYIMLNTYM